MPHSSSSGEEPSGSRSAPSAGIGDLPGTVERFLLKALKEKSCLEYTAALRDLRTEVEAAQFPWRTASAWERDVFLAELLVERQEAGCRRQASVIMITALHKILPHQRF